ncbi:hypothetical protein ACH4PU_12695 [Streptomyces sp. NPDC021100]|uniref:hypothetical protein n=1 Tax=Streptomyces sp. NPDC021100 TaxID=3365114 RepID=UPI0037B52194
MRPTFPVQVLLVLLAFTTSLLVAVAAGVLSRATGEPTAGAVLYGGGAFLGWMTLSVAVLSALGLLGGGARAGGGD